MMQHALKLCKCLHLVDVGAVIDRPRAINNRPYGFYRGFFVFRNAPYAFDQISTPRNFFARIPTTKETTATLILIRAISRKRFLKG